MSGIAGLALHAPITPEVAREIEVALAAAGIRRFLVEPATATVEVPLRFSTELVGALLSPEGVAFGGGRMRLCAGGAGNELELYMTTDEG